MVNKAQRHKSLMSWYFKHLGPFPNKNKYTPKPIKFNFSPIRTASGISHDNERIPDKKNNPKRQRKFKINIEEKRNDR